jgi:hypothetical protein
MTQHVTDLGERGAVAQHLGRQRVSKLMCTLGGRIDPSSLERTSDDTADGARAQKPADGGFGLQEHTTALAPRPTMLQIGHYGFADISG